MKKHIRLKLTKNEKEQAADAVWAVHDLLENRGSMAWWNDASTADEADLRLAAAYLLEAAGMLKAKRLKCGRSLS